MVDPGRRRLIRLAGLAAVTGVGGSALAIARYWRASSTPGAPVAAPTSSTQIRPTTSTTRAPTTTQAPATTTTPEVGDPRERVEDGGGNTAASTVFRLLCRDAWGAQPPTRALAAHEVRGIMVHHTGVVLHDPRDGPRRVRGHQGFHLRSGFADLAYHVVIDGAGNAYEGRDPSQPGETFTEYDPTGWLLIACEGNFDDQPFPEQQFEALVRVVSWAVGSYGVPLDMVVAHRDISPTRCPGTALHARFTDGSLSARVQSARHSVTLEGICGPEGQAEVAAIEAGTSAAAR